MNLGLEFSVYGCHCLMFSDRALPSCVMQFRISSTGVSKFSDSAWISEFVRFGVVSWCVRESFLPCLLAEVLGCEPKPISPQLGYDSSALYIPQATEGIHCC